MQRTTTEFLSASNPEINIEFVPITPAFENKTLHFFNNLLNKIALKGHIVIIDTPAGTSQRLWNLVGESYCVLIPTSLSNADLALLKVLLKVWIKLKQGNQVYPHLII